MLDFEHKNLIGMVNSVEYAIKNRDSFALLQTIKLLLDSVQSHFANEERFARAIDLPFDQHRLLHQHLQKELQSTWNELDIKRGMWVEHVMDHYPQFLREWLVDHIAKEDMAMKQTLQSHPYDFKPD